jgi:hypothetical protein
LASTTGAFAKRSSSAAVLAFGGGTSVYVLFTTAAAAWEAAEGALRVESGALELGAGVVPGPASRARVGAGVAFAGSIVGNWNAGAWSSGSGACFSFAGTRNVSANGIT